MFGENRVLVIGAGFSSLSAACYLAQAGCAVTVYEQHAVVGGRARRFERDGFRFDMGPTFYWMPDVFERFFADFGCAPSDFYRLQRLDPGYELYFGPHDTLHEPADAEALTRTFESIEAGSGRFLERFLSSARFNYRVAMDKVVYKPGDSPWELLMPQTLMRLPQFLFSLRHTVRHHIKNPRLRCMLEFPVLFLGAKPSSTPSFYRFMNYADMKLGTWHVVGGMAGVAEGMQRLAERLGVCIETGASVGRIITERRRVTGLVVNGRIERADAVVSGADYHHTEALLPEGQRNYTEKYWHSRVFAPSAILFYIAFDRKLEGVCHHTLFFDAPFDIHAACIYDRAAWPARPLFYASFPSHTDASCAPPGKEAAIVLIPCATGLEDTPQVRSRYFSQVIRRMEEATGQPLRQHVLFYRSYAGGDFVRDYHAYGGNAYGLANILSQTAFLKPKIRNRHLPNLFYTGQLTVPGPGVPTAVISGKIAARCALAYLRKACGQSLGGAEGGPSARHGDLPTYKKI